MKIYNTILKRHNLKRVVAFDLSHITNILSIFEKSLYMKKIFYLIICLFSTSSLCAQFTPSRTYDSLYCDFESPCESIAIPDSSIWIIGKPQKTLFDSAHSGVYAIVTDTIQNYPKNHHSYFDIVIQATPLFSLEFDYKTDFDSFHAGGFITVSVDKGGSWMTLDSLWQYFDEGSIDFYNYYEYDTLFNGNWGISGTKDEWTRGIISITQEYPVSHSAPPPPIVHDTIIFRFNMVSDSLAVEKEGWLIDNIKVLHYHGEGIHEIANNINVIIAPNPCKEVLNITLPQQNNSATYQVQIMDVTGRTIQTTLLRNGANSIDVHKLQKGLYILLLSDQEGNSGVQKFMKE